VRGAEPLRAPRPARRARVAAAGAFDDQAFRRALGRFATGIIVLTVGPRRAPHAMTANAFMSGSLAPPLVVVSVALRARMHAKLAAARRFGVSILGQAQETASRHFAGQPVAGFVPAFADLAGVPVLAAAAAAIAARIAYRYECGDHTLVVGEVEALVVDPDAAPLLYHGGRYAALRPTAAPPGAMPDAFPSFF
jgi:flavin reductase (DIM6/NTAB) family NADH-FMN oxidoreductase RutF